MAGGGQEEHNGMNMSHIIFILHDISGISTFPGVPGEDTGYMRMVARGVPSGGGPLHSSEYS